MYKFIEEQIFPLQEAKVLVVSHGLAIKCLLRKILDSAPSMTRMINIANTSMTILRYSSINKWEILAVNQQIH